MIIAHIKRFQLSYYFSFPLVALDNLEITVRVGLVLMKAMKIQILRIG